MKKFFKTLALVLALALVVGILPATTASAGVKKNKTLYVNGPQGASTTDETAKSSYKERVAIYKLAGYTKAKAEGHTFEAKLVSGEDWVKVGKKYVKAIGYSNGKAAVVEIYVDGERVGSTNIKTRINASKDTLSILCNDGELPEKFIVGAKYTFALPRAKKDSDERRLFINGTQLKDIEGKDRQYEYTFAKADAGKNAVIKYEAFQSETLDKATVSSGDIEIPVGFAEAKEAKQTAATEVTVTFKDFAEGYVAEDFSLYYLNAAGVKITDKVVKSATYDKEKNAYVVVTYTDFVKDTEYHVVVGDSDVTFTAKSNTVKDVDHFVINEDTIIVGGFQEVTFTYYDAEGMKLDINPGTTLEKVSATADTAVAANTSIYLAKADDSIVVKGVYYTIDENYNSVPHYSEAKTIKGVAATSAYTPVAFTLSNNADGLGVKDNLSDFTIKHDFKNGDNAYMHVILSYTDNATGKVKYVDAASEPGITELNFSSAAEKIMVAETDTKTGRLHPVAASGKATIVVKDKDGGVIYAGEVEMGAARYFYAFETSLSKSTFNTDAYVADSVTLEIKALDQYNDPWTHSIIGGTAALTVSRDATASSAEVSAVNVGAADESLVGSKGITKYPITFTLTGATADKAYTGVVKVAAKQTSGSKADLVKKLGVSVSDVTKAANSYQWTADKNSFDMALTTTTDDDVTGTQITVSLNEFYNGYKKGATAATFATATPVTAKVASAAALEFVYTVAKDGKVLGSLSGDFFNTATDGVLKINPFKVDANKITKMDKGTYTIVAYKKAAAAAGATQVVSVLSSTTVTISDTQVLPVITRTNTDKLAEDYTAGDLSDADALTVARNYFTPSFKGANLEPDVVITAAEGKADASGAVVITKVVVQINLAVNPDNGDVANSVQFIELPASGLPLVIYK